MAEPGSWISPEDRDIIRADSMKTRFQERKPTILDPRQRRLGLDLEAIQRQIEEKREREAREKARNGAFDHMLLDQQNIIMQNQEAERLSRRQMGKDRDEFRRTNQRAEQQREYDIWRHDINQVTDPIRMGDDDPRLGVSAGQIFQGEDLKIKERRRLQQQQMDAFHAEQLREKQLIRDREEAEDLRNQITEIETQKTLVQLHEQTENAKGQVRLQLAQDNRQLSAQKRQREIDDRLQDERMRDAELRANARTRTITEQMARRGDAPMEYRGMTVDEQKAIIDEQYRQMEEAERLRQAEREREQQWNEYQTYLKAQGDLNEAEFMKRRAQANADLANTHFQQEREFKERQRYLNKDLYGTNVPDDSYFNQWGNSIR